MTSISGRLLTADWMTPIGADLTCRLTQGGRRAPSQLRREIGRTHLQMGLIMMDICRTSVVNSMIPIFQLRIFAVLAEAVQETARPANKTALLGGEHLSSMH